MAHTIFQHSPASLPHNRIVNLMGVNMVLRNAFQFALVAAFASHASIFSSSTALAQSASDVVGTWTLVSSVTEKDGTRTDQFGSGAKGMMTLDADGHFMLTIIGPDLPKFASNNRAGGTSEENKAVVSKSIAMIGTYSVNSADKTLSFKVDSATFPNWNGTEQKRLLSSSNKDELKYITPTASSGGVGTVTWTRAK
jgi:Lipocalin-like domain